MIIHSDSFPAGMIGYSHQGHTWQYTIICENFIFGQHIIEGIINHQKFFCGKYTVLSNHEQCLHPIKTANAIRNGQWRKSPFKARIREEVDHPKESDYWARDYSRSYQEANIIIVDSLFHESLKQC